MKLRKTLIASMILLVLAACSHKAKVKTDFSQAITDPLQRDSLFQNLMGLTKNSIPQTQAKDSLLFLVLPVEAACPSCRKKTIDSVIKYKDRLNEQRYVIITGTGRKIIESYFKERGYDLPFAAHNIFVDSVNEAFIHDVIFTRPEIFYAYNNEVYRKVSCVSVNIKAELAKFFSPEGLTGKTESLSKK